MSWLDKLENKRGSQPRCVLFMEGDREKVAKRLSDLVGLPDVLVSSTDTWMPCGKSNPGEVELDKADGLLPSEIRQELAEWWLAVGIGRARTPVWDIASRCSIGGNWGLILVEAKAHYDELKKKDTSGSGGENRKSIAQAFDEANRNLHSATGGSWNLALSPHYQLSNRFAWSWKLASLGVPVVLVYLGFLNAQDMTCDSLIFKSKADWKRVLKTYGETTIDNTFWEQRLCFNDTPFIPLIRACNQPFNPKNP